MVQKAASLWVMLVLAVILSGCTNSAAGADYTAFAKCLTENNAKMYGAFWCPHCQNQKEMFGSSWENVNYIECSLPDKSGQTKVCKDAGIKAYHTWEFADGRRIEGELSFLQLSQLSGCSVSGN
ncbi:hypothetical protein HYU09_03635 [Candidatus Woesearchaeota archaeon]|nr:hypothetical protein [Candidatus Woesearchaeota archaeon]